MATQNLRIPPHSIEAEESVLGALLIDKDAIIAIAEFLKPDDFYDERHKDIFEAAVTLYDERIPLDVHIWQALPIKYLLPRMLSITEK
ncbi:MAG: Replicative DNA helicase [Candidatus Woesebacteria bacterium GW2011_GWB1_38_8b]|uniref:Replicative DNA helicase n=1 Tax=Candidatus Woesebacteria bacterium GW2011_GWB1_38_8b TaxID=1618571 RepID=A0A0G0L556_9BACT|nr:MAG: Replicative DNA helicase [Candidatus Woesebacteria bacterium GW2011_GWB1_38_8b]